LWLEESQFVENVRVLLGDQICHECKCLPSVGFIRELKDRIRLRLLCRWLVRDLWIGVRG